MTSDDTNTTTDNMATDSVQILKCRDDKAPVLLSKDAEADELSFRMAEGRSCSWLSKGETVGPDKLRPRIESWLTALFQSEHFSLLVGSSLTRALHWMAADNPLPGMGWAEFSHYSDEIDAEAKRSPEAAVRSEGNIEDQFRVANELLRELPSLPSQNAILLGWASQLPFLVKMKDLPKSHQPHSDDPEFWNVWTRQSAEGQPLLRKADWKAIADDWQGNIASSAEADS